MLIKSATDMLPTITSLETLLPGATSDQKKMIEEDLRRIRAGAKGESEAAYLIDFDFKASRNTAVIHDLRLEINGRIAQIDHLLIHRTLNVYVLESKHFHAGLKITDGGEFLRWNDWRKTFEGMPSPLAQNERHIAVLKDAFSSIEMPTRLGIRLPPIFTSLVMVSAHTRIDRPKTFDTAQIIKADALGKAVHAKMDNDGLLETLGSVARMVSSETLEDIAQRIAALHRPAAFDYSAKYSKNQHQPREQENKEAPEKIPKNPVTSHFVPRTGSVCPKCKQHKLERRSVKRTDDTETDYLSCAGYPNTCDAIFALVALVSSANENKVAENLPPIYKTANQGTPQKPKAGDVCPSCNKGKMVFHNGRKGLPDFLGCTGYNNKPPCKFKAQLDKIGP